MSDTSDRASPGPFDLVLRAVFVPDGEQPPPEFTADFDPLKFRASLDTESGEITCDGAGTNFDGDIRAEWHPDEEEGSDEGQDAAGQGNNAPGTGGAGEGSWDGQRDRDPDPGKRPVGGTMPARPGERIPFGLAGNGPGLPSSPTIPRQASISQDSHDPCAGSSSKQSE